MTDPISYHRLREMLNDPSVPDSEIAPYLIMDSEESRAFYPVVKIDEQKIDDPGEEGAILLRALNSLSRARRQTSYRRRIADGWDGLRFVSEGDSWFQFPFLLHDTIDHLMEDYAILSFGAAGDLLKDMLIQDEMVGALETEKAHGLLISGGGNDLLGEGRLKTYLDRFEPGREPVQYLNEHFEPFLGEILTHYRRLFERVLSRLPRTQIFCHAYDQAIPQSGKWLGKPMKELGIMESNLEWEIIKVVVGRFNDALAEMVAAHFADKVHYVNCLGAVPIGHWYDELHPDDLGYGKVAERFKERIGTVFA
jgi:hypothetical protein